MSAALLDAQGCLTAAGLDTIARSAAGRAPDDLAVHLASCRRCQARALARDTAASKRAARPASSMTVRLARVGGLALLGFLVALAAILALRGTAGP